MPDPFISREDLSDFTGQSLNASDKALIVVDAASEIVRTLTGQLFNEVEDDTVLMDGTGTDCILLPHYPVSEISSVVENDELLTEMQDYVLHDDMLMRVPTVVDSGWSTQTLRRYWPMGRRNLEITYSHGYAADDLPRDIRYVALAMAARMFNSSESGTGTVISETLGQYSVRYSDESNTSDSELPLVERLIIRKHKRTKQAATSVAVS